MQTSCLSSKELFLNALCKRDINTLRHILDNDITYFGVSKQTFLERMSYLFIQIGLAGQKGDLVVKQHKKHVNTYYVHSKVLKTSFKFIIDEDNGKILRVYNNKKVESLAVAESISLYDLYFGLDERVGFEPTDKYISTLQECESAYKELENGTMKIITSQEMDSWIGRHMFLFLKIYPQYNYFKFNDFRCLFQSLSYYNEILEQYDWVCEALESFDQCKEDEIDIWCDEYNRLFFCHTMSFQGIPLVIDNINRRIRYSQNSNIYFTGDDFWALHKFSEIYATCLEKIGFYNL